MYDPLTKPKSCRLFRVRQHVVVLRDDFLGRLRVGNNEEAEVMSLSPAFNDADAAQVGEAVLRAFERVVIIPALPEYPLGYVPFYLQSLNLASFKELEEQCASCVCIQSKDYKDQVCVVPSVYNKKLKGFEDDRSKQALSEVNPTVLGRNALNLLVTY